MSNIEYIKFANDIKCILHHIQRSIFLIVLLICGHYAPQDIDVDVFIKN